ncbi:hypothetical protein CLF_103746, partial [Clonorchis sinensis]
MHLTTQGVTEPRQRDSLVTESRHTSHRTVTTVLRTVLLRGGLKESAHMKTWDMGYMDKSVVRTPFSASYFRWSTVPKEVVRRCYVRKAPWINRALLQRRSECRFRLQRQTPYVDSRHILRRRGKVLYDIQFGTARWIRYTNQRRPKNTQIRSTGPSMLSVRRPSGYVIGDRLSTNQMSARSRAGKRPKISANPVRTRLLAVALPNCERNQDSSTVVELTVSSVSARFRLRTSGDLEAAAAGCAGVGIVLSDREEASSPDRIHFHTRRCVVIAAKPVKDFQMRKVDYCLFIAADYPSIDCISGVVKDRFYDALNALVRLAKRLFYAAIASKIAEAACLRGVLQRHAAHKLQSTKLPTVSDARRNPVNRLLSRLSRLLIKRGMMDPPPYLERLERPKIISVELCDRTPEGTSDTSTINGNLTTHYTEIKDHGFRYSCTFGFPHQVQYQVTRALYYTRIWNNLPYRFRNITYHHRFSQSVDNFLTCGAAAGLINTQPLPDPLYDTGLTNLIPLPRFPKLLPSLIPGLDAMFGCNPLHIAYACIQRNLQPNARDQQKVPGTANINSKRVQCEKKSGLLTTLLQVVEIEGTANINSKRVQCEKKSGLLTTLLQVVEIEEYQKNTVLLVTAVHAPLSKLSIYDKRIGKKLDKIQFKASKCPQFCTLTSEHFSEHSGLHLDYFVTEAKEEQTSGIKRYTDAEELEKQKLVKELLNLINKHDTSKLDNLVLNNRKKLRAIVNDKTACLTPLLHTAVRIQEQAIISVLVNELKA